MLTKCAVNNQINAVTSFNVNREGEKCNLTGLVRLEGGAGNIQETTKRQLVRFSGLLQQGWREGSVTKFSRVRQSAETSSQIPKGGLQHGHKMFQCCNSETAHMIVDVLFLSNPAVPFDPGSREITLSLMYQDDIIKIGHVFEVWYLRASKKVQSVTESAHVYFSKVVMRTHLFSKDILLKEELSQ